MKVANAYEILKDNESRADYDYMLDNPGEFKLSVLINSMWPCATTWWHIFGSILAHVMAWCLAPCLMAQSHYLNLFWLLASEVHSSGSNFIVNGQATFLNMHAEFNDYIFKVIDTFLWGQCVSNISLVILNEAIWLTSIMQNQRQSYRMIYISRNMKEDISEGPGLATQYHTVTNLMP